jgi:SAM-dependent methyltransferase
MRAILRDWLAHPLTRGVDIDDPQTTGLRRKIIQDKPLLRHVYEDWYSAVLAEIPEGDGGIVELGSGAGFLDTYVPRLITSEIFYQSGLTLVADGLALPFRDQSLRAIVMTDVLHHLPHPQRFLSEAARCLRPGGAVVMQEPWVSGWSRLVYRLLHHEPFLPSAATWDFPRSGPLSGANGALPWIIFERDRPAFESAFPQFRIRGVRPHTALRYLVSGGVSTRNVMPGWTLPVWHLAETVLKPWGRTWAMFAQITLLRLNDDCATKNGGGQPL